VRGLRLGVLPRPQEQLAVGGPEPRLHLPEPDLLPQAPVPIQRLGRGGADGEERRVPIPSLLGDHADLEALPDRSHQRGSALQAEGVLRHDRSGRGLGLVHWSGKPPMGDDHTPGGPSDGNDDLGSVGLEEDETRGLLVVDAADEEREAVVGPLAAGNGSTTAQHLTSRVAASCKIDGLVVVGVAVAHGTSSSVGVHGSCKGPRCLIHRGPRVAFASRLVPGVALSPALRKALVRRASLL
jgi:hypothetical protein